MRKMLAIFAHPDDEGAIAGTLAHYADAGVEVSLICATKGEAGEISDPALATPETLGEVRTAELQAACEILGIQPPHFLGYRDSGMADTPANEDSRSLVQADDDEAIGRLVGLMRQLKPDIVITFEPYGWYGHPDHLAVHRLATEAYDRVGDAVAYPDIGQPWQPQCLYYAVLPVSKFRVIIDYARANNLAEMDDFEPLEVQLESEAQITHILDMQRFLETKQKSMAAHQTQFDPDSLFMKLPQAVVREAWGHEHFILVRPTSKSDLKSNHATDLFTD